MKSLIGRTIGRYRILAALGEGGMGEVYRALDTTLNREVALKVLPPDVTSDANRQRQFMREAQTASQIEHAHVGVIHEVGEADGVTFIAMELIRGQSLRDLVARGVPATRVVELAIEIAEGLARAHDLDVLHRDLKPANVMITEDGHAKIIDFGLAKALESGTASSDASTVAASTAEGVIKGTASYMSPEQTRGQRLDARSDLFSFGVMLYQMISGRLPFQAPSYVDTLHAIAHDPVPPLAAVAGLSPDAQHELQRLIDKCLAKDPDARYQTARDLIVDLRTVRRRIDGVSTSSAPSVSVSAAATLGTQAGRRRRALMWAASAVIVLAAGVIWWKERPPSAPPPLASGGKPSVAVLYFQNNTGSPELDWLRTGLTNMVVTDLSQSVDMSVLSTERLHQILASLKRQNEPVLAFDTVREVARIAGVDHVLIGDYIKAGETIRINVTLQEAGSGRIVTAEHLEAAGESSLFPTVDTLTRRLQTHLVRAAGPAGQSSSPLIQQPGAAGAAPAQGLYRDLQDVTTSSIDAYRAYAQGVSLLESSRPAEARPLLLKALAIDPDFALAMARLAAVENNLRNPDGKAKYAKLALEHADRLTPADRYYVEGFHYAGGEDTVEQGIAAYQKLLSIQPLHYSGTHNLAVLYGDTEQYGKVVELLETLRKSPVVLPITLGNLAGAYAYLDQPDKSLAVADEYERRFPGASPLRARGDALLTLGRLDDALSQYDKADTLDGGDPTGQLARWAIAVLQDRWADVEVQTAMIGRQPDPFSRAFVLQARATREMYRGRSAAALDILASVPKSAQVIGPTFGALLALQETRARVGLGQAEAALIPAARARRAPGPTLLASSAQGRYYTALALSRLGRDADARGPIDEIAARAAASPSSRESRRVHQLAGIIALDHHNLPAAVRELEQAEALLPPRSSWGPPPPQPELWFALGSAHLAAGHDADAQLRFSRLVSSVERVAYPIEFVRSLYLLGQIAERRGDLPKAREYYTRFLSYWGGGDIDRDRLADARRKTAAK